MNTLYAAMNTLMTNFQRSLFAAGLLIAAGIGNTHAAENPLKLIELFTSHGCSSCPSAEKLAGELQAADADLVLIEYHVDYWDTLVHGSDGSFVDPFSNSEYSDRQRLYNRVGLRGRPGVYTPQAVINGRIAAVGSDKRRISKALAQGTQSAMAIDIVTNDADSLIIKVTGSDADRKLAEGAEILLVDIIEKTVTEITGGENRHKVLTNHNVATAIKRLGRVGNDADISFTVPRPANNMGCIVLVQDVGLNPVFAAAQCP